MTPPPLSPREKLLAERRDEIAAWSRCAWCWNQLPADPVRKAGRPYCDERCAGHDASVAIDAGPDTSQVDVSDYQMSLDTLAGQ